MPVQFVCPHCDQLLSVGSRKIGCEVACPRCQNMVVVPTHEVAAVGVAMRQSLRSQAAEQQVMSAAEFTVYDDIPAVLEGEPAIQIDTGPGSGIQTEKQIAPPPKRQKAPLWGFSDESDHLPTPMLLLSRRAVYCQAALLAGVAVMSLLAGLLIGRGVGPDSKTAGPAQGPIVVQGTVRFASDGNTTPDTGAVVLVLPEGKTPNPKISVQGLRPGDPEAEANSAALAAIGGAVRRAAGDGTYQLQLPEPGQYLFLIISQQAQRPADTPIDAFQRAIMERYFDRPEDLIGRSQYLWKVENLRGAAHFDYTFAAAAAAAQ